MKTNTKVVIIFLLFILVISGSVSVYADNSDRLELVAQVGLMYFLDKIPEGSEGDFGFMNRHEFDWAFLGEPYEMYTIHPDLLINEHPVGAGFFTSLEMWRFPVLSQGRMRTLLTVAKVNGEWKAVEIGGSGIASELDRLENIYSFDRNNTKRILLRMFNIKSDFVSLGDRNQPIEETLFAPLKSAQLQLTGSINERLIYSLPELVGILQKKYQSLILDFPIEAPETPRRPRIKKEN